MSKSSVASKRWFAGSNAAEAFERIVVPLMRRIAELPFIAAIRDALPWSFLGLLGAFAFFLVVELPAPHAAPVPLGLRVASALLPSFAIMAAALVVILSVRLARATAYSREALLSGGLAAFALSLPRPNGLGPEGYLRSLGPSGLFLAILACGVTAFWIWLLRPRVAGPAADWAGAALAAATFAAVAAAGFSLPGAIAAAMHPIALLGDTYAALFLIVLIETLLWTAGIHGPAVLASIVTPVYLTMQLQNTNAFERHGPLPYIVVVSLFLFVFPGGAGATLPLAALLAISRVGSLRRIGRATLLPSLFNFNEPLLFAAPVVFNPHLMLPFVVAPLLLATLTYAAVAHDFVARAALYVPSAIPTVVSTYLATQDVRAIALVALNVAIATVVYLPFVRAYEKHLLRQAQHGVLRQAQHKPTA
ncbi:MAG: PTS sugar transporter subunit IIC [Candidatus Eremiobacteraeota bacterium]|nr:PTS sugar transporter subunit IIC [Candidatus Eremiobacteraeota bacterium]